MNHLSSQEVNEHFTMYCHRTATCPGDSGMLLLLVLSRAPAGYPEHPGLGAARYEGRAKVAAKALPKTVETDFRPKEIHGRRPTDSDSAFG